MVKKCRECETEFLSFGNRKLFCSSLCSQRNWRRNRYRELNLRGRYGITVEEYKSMVESQGNRCAICRDVLKRAHVDHDHKTGKIRKLLCRTCNTVLLSGARESPRILFSAIGYLRAHR